VQSKFIAGALLVFLVTSMFSSQSAFAGGSCFFDIDCDDGNVCTNNECLGAFFGPIPFPGSCFNTPNVGTQCDDEDPNTQNDICEAGVCSGVTPGGFSCGLGTTPNVITNECEPDVTQADLDSVEAQRDAILTTLFEFLRVFGVI